MAERWYSRLSRMLRHEMKERQPVILYASNAHFQQTNTLGGAPGEGTGGVTEAFKRRIVLPVGASLAETDHVLGPRARPRLPVRHDGPGPDLGHELPVRPAHAALVHRGHGRIPLGGAGGPAHRDVDARRRPPREGPAHPPPARRQRASTSPTATARRPGPTSPPATATPCSGACCAASGPHTNDAGDVHQVRPARRPGRALQGVARRHPRRPTRRRPAGKKDADAYGAALVTEKGQGGRLNVGPVLSPDGDQPGLPLRARPLLGRAVPAGHARPAT